MVFQLAACSQLLGLGDYVDAGAEDSSQAVSSSDATLEVDEGAHDGSGVDSSGEASITADARGPGDAHGDRADVAVPSRDAGLSDAGCQHLYDCCARLEAAGTNVSGCLQAAEAGVESQCASVLSLLPVGLCP
jgi:hypothetical protein